MTKYTLIAKYADGRGSEVYNGDDLNEVCKAEAWLTREAYREKIPVPKFELIERKVQS